MVGKQITLGKLGVPFCPSSSAVETTVPAHKWEMAPQVAPIGKARQCRHGSGLLGVPFLLSPQIATVWYPLPAGTLATMCLHKF